MDIIIALSLTLISVAISIILLQILKIKSDQRDNRWKISRLEIKYDLYIKQAMCPHNNVKFIEPVECDALGYRVNLLAKMKCLDCKKILKEWTLEEYKEYKKAELEYLKQRTQNLEVKIKEQDK